MTSPPVEQQVGIDGVVLRDRSDRRSRLQAALYEFALERLIVFAATDPAGRDSILLIASAIGKMGLEATLTPCTP